MSIGFEIELQNMRISARLPGQREAGALQYNVFKGLPLFRTQNRRIAGVIEYAGRGGPSILEIVTAPDENPYEERDDGWVAQIDNVLTMAETIEGLGQSALPLSQVLAKLNQALTGAWQVAEDSSLARYIKIKAGERAGAPLPTQKGGVKGKKEVAIPAKDLAIALTETLCLRPGSAQGDVQISFSTTLAKLGDIIEGGYQPFADLIEWCNGEGGSPEAVAVRMLNDLLDPLREHGRVPSDVLGFLYLVFHRLAAEGVAQKFKMVGKNRFVALPRFNLRKARAHLEKGSHKFLRGLVGEGKSFYDNILEIATSASRTKGKLALNSQLSSFLQGEHGHKVDKINTYGAFLYAVFEDKVFSPAKALPSKDDVALSQVDAFVVDVEDTTHCPVELRGCPNLVFELRTQPDGDSLDDKLRVGAQKVLAYDSEPTLEPKSFALRKPRDPKAWLSCGTCGAQHGRFPSGPTGHWHICAQCYFVYCNVCGSLLKPSATPRGYVRTTRACDECPGDTELVTW